MLRLSVNDTGALVQVCHALSTPLRANIIKSLDNRVLSCLELSKILGYPLSTISSNVKILEDAGLLQCELLPAKNGSKKMCSLIYSDFSVLLGHGAAPEPLSRCEASIPIGNYMDFDVSPTCGYVTDRAAGEDFDSPEHFYKPERVNAQLLWFRKGYVEYRVPLTRRPEVAVKSLSFSLEICSEYPGFNSKWKSDITMWINGVEIGTWTSPSDFGDRPGNITPAWWTPGNTQYGLLTTWSVAEDGATINGSHLSQVCLRELELDKHDAVRMRIGVKSTSANIGGINLFGEKFGDYPQAIQMLVQYKSL